MCALSRRGRTTHAAAGNPGLEKGRATQAAAGYPSLDKSRIAIARNREIVTNKKWQAVLNGPLRVWGNGPVWGKKRAKMLKQLNNAPWRKRLSYLRDLRGNGHITWYSEENPHGLQYEHLTGEFEWHESSPESLSLVQDTDNAAGIAAPVPAVAAMPVVTAIGDLAAALVVADVPDESSEDYKIDLETCSADDTIVVEVPADIVAVVPAPHDVPTTGPSLSIEDYEVYLEIYSAEDTIIVEVPEE